jgi:hypothetical protein
VQKVQPQGKRCAHRSTEGQPLPKPVRDVHLIGLLHGCLVAVPTLHPLYPDHYVGVLPHQIPMGFRRISSYPPGCSSPILTLRLASISAASTAAWAYARRKCGSACHGSVSQWAASPFSATRVPRPVPRGRGPCPCSRPSGLGVSPTSPRRSRAQPARRGGR